MERSAASNTLRRGRAKALASPTASRRRCYNQAAYRGQASLTTDARAVQRERASAAQRRLSVTPGVEQDRTARRCGSGAKATCREWRKESAPAGARQARRCRHRRACDRERSWRMVVLGRRIARGGRERGAKPSPPATNGRSRSRSGHRSAGRSRSCYPSRPWPASGRCGVSPLEWGGRDADSTAGKDLSPSTPGHPACLSKPENSTGIQNRVHAHGRF